MTITGGSLCLTGLGLKERKTIMKTLVLAEKPSVARDIARVLGCTRSLEGAIEGKDYVVTWGLGHLVELSDPEEYSDDYKEWRLDLLPMMPEPFRLTVIRQTARQFRAVKAQLFRKDVGQIVIATDAGREGELVARLILEKTGCNKPAKRLWISSVTDKAIREGFAHLKDSREYDSLRDAAMSRAEADWLVGINATRALTCKYNAQLSCGRVQTPTLAIIAKREQEIREFVPKSYYGIKGEYGGLKLVWQDGKTKSRRTFDKNRAETLIRQLSGEKAQIKERKQIPKSVQPPLLYDLTELQREANRRYQYSAKETLNLCQRLYENHKVLTYPRTDSRYLSSDILPTIPERLKACATGPYRKLAGRALGQKISPKAFFVNNARVSDHHAIIPTEQFVQLDHMTIDERRIYDLVVRRFLAVLYPPYEYQELKVTVSIGAESFVSSFGIVTEKGWKEVYEEENGKTVPGEGMEEEEDLSAISAPPEALGTLKEGETLLPAGPAPLTLTEGKTRPPARFTEGSLLAAMENPAAYMETEDEKEKKAMVKTLGETGGLGTVATRADIIEKLFHSFLLEKKGQEIYLTPKAKQLLELVPRDLRTPELTARWEGRLMKIAEGKESRDRFMKDIRDYTNSLTGEIKAGEGSFRHDNMTNKKCPVCGKRLLAVNGKNSQMLVCQDRECGYRETVSRASNARCPKCRKKMDLKGSGEGKIFVCRCGYKEKLSSFTERRKKEGAGVSKRDVARYLNQQKKEAETPINSPFADAFAKLNLDK